MDRNTFLWTLTLFFGGSILFAAVNRWTDGEPTLVRLGIQIAVLAVVIAGLVLLLRRKR